MDVGLRKFDEAVAGLIAPGQPFAVETIDIGGVEYRNYSAMPANLGQYFRLMQRHGDKDFALYLQERYTFDQAYNHSAEFAGALMSRYGVRKGDRVAILSRNNPQWMMAFIAVTVHRRSGGADERLVDHRRTGLRIRGQRRQGGGGRPGPDRAPAAHRRAARPADHFRG